MLAPNIWATNPKSLKTFSRWQYNFQMKTVLSLAGRRATSSWRFNVQDTKFLVLMLMWKGYNLVDMQSTKTLKNGKEWNSNGSFVVKTWIGLQYHAISVLLSLHYLKWRLIKTDIGNVPGHWHIKQWFLHNRTIWLEKEWRLNIQQNKDGLSMVILVWNKNAFSSIPMKNTDKSH